MNSGIQFTTAPVEWNPSSFSAQVCWNVSTRTPNAAPAESRFTAAVVSAITNDRNTQPIISIVSTTTKPITHGIADDRAWSTSRLVAVSPPTAHSAPSMPRSALATSPSRSSCTPCFAAADSAS